MTVRPFAALAVTFALLLQGCGVDGPPVPPSQVERERDRAGADIAITGTASIGIVGGS
ncbi:hypothetical protein [Jannaschia sp. LMIT008]|uniref:hypothetical protein n=1 Tax=Jannaschia maritima TaxID=3032585 RepID=UPI002810E799|nr:hypothetical protein [Jannaschia sp. LMIT008]